MRYWNWVPKWKNPDVTPNSHAIQKFKRDHRPKYESKS